ncbi:ABC transporter ATP-binding/permease protein [methanogenic archaeon mixed culture ISO4-G1]|nr:ABC transporter ATP-binding/permease protein [methanogenic archaeon mixed culture ISO4-G1]
MIIKYFNRRDWILTAVTACIAIVQVFLDLKLPEYMSLITDAFLVEDTDVVMRYGIEMLVCAFANLGLGIVAGYLTGYISSSVARTIRQKQFEKVQRLSVENIDRFSAASLITRSTNDVLHIQSFIARCLVITFRAPVLTGWAVIKILEGDPAWAYATAIATVIMVINMLVCFGIALPKIKRVQWLTDDINRNARENLSGVRVIRAFNAEDYQERKFFRANDALTDNNLFSMRVLIPSGPISATIASILVLCIYWMGAGIISGIYGYDEQLLMFSDMVMYATYASLILYTVSPLVYFYQDYPRALICMRRIEEVLDEEVAVKDGDQEDGVDGMEGCVEFRNVSFRYPGSPVDTIRNISFKVDKGETLAIIGPTGSGKTTLLNLLERFYDVTEGSILVDGRDIREYTHSALSAKMGLMTQNAYVFSGSASYNIALDDDVDGDRLQKAIDLSESGFVNGLPDGTSSHLSQNGKNLSGGQKQRVSIARAFYRDPEIYIFDDTFSALDYRTEHDVRQSLSRELKDSTKIIVAQRISTVVGTDRILVLDNGSASGYGTHEELIATCGLYRDILESQEGGAGIGQ